MIFIRKSCSRYDLRPIANHLAHNTKQGPYRMCRVRACSWICMTQQPTPPASHTCHFFTAAVITVTDNRRWELPVDLLPGPFYLCVCERFLIEYCTIFGYCMYEWVRHRIIIIIRWLYVFLWRYHNQTIAYHSKIPTCFPDKITIEASVIEMITQLHLSK